MAESFVIRGFCGSRAEGDAGLAERIGSLLGRLDALLPGGVDRWDLAKGDPLAVGDQAGLASYVRELAEEARREAHGLGIVFVSTGRGSDGARFRVTVSAGGTALVPGLMNSVVVGLAWPSGDVDGQLAMARDALVALVEEWDPDWGDIYTPQLSKYLGDRVGRRIGKPRAGYSFYLSGFRWAAARAVGLPGRLRELAGGGVVSLDGERGSLPSVDQVVALDEALVSAGAFEPTPVDRPHLGDADRISHQEAGDVSHQEADHAMKLTLKYQPVAENASLFARDIVEVAQQIPGMDLDYSAASLRHVDAIIEDMRSDGAPADAVGETLFGFGTYVGEVLVRNAGGRWIDFNETQKGLFGHALGIEMPGGGVCNPLGKVFKRLENGVEDSIDFFYQVASKPRPAP